MGSQGKSRDFELAALLGAIAFGLSDTLLALNRFIWHDTLTMFSITEAAPFIPTLTMTLYWLGQCGLALAAGWEAKDRARGGSETRMARPREQSPLSDRRKVAYGAGDSGFSLTSTALALLYLFFLVNVVGLDPAAAGISIGIGRIWDAFNDIFVGTLSDRTRSRWGRRRPYLLFGAIPLGIAFVLMWLVPPTDQQTLLLIYYTAMYILFDTLFTLTNVPYIALTPEIAPTYDERTSLHSYRMAFSIGFGLIGAVAPLAIVDAIAGPNPTLTDLRSAYAAMAVILGVQYLPDLHHLLCRA